MCGSTKRQDRLPYRKCGSLAFFKDLSDRKEAMRIRKQPNMLSYLREYGGYSFEERPFSETDSLILAQLAYLKYEGLVPGFRGERKAAKPISFRELAANPLRDKMFADPVYGKKYARLFGLVSGCRRFKELKADYFVNIVSQGGGEREIQFSAITFFLEGGRWKEGARSSDRCVYVAFRGTDENLIGWKEDLNMSYMTPVPSQKAALAYFRKVASLHDGPILIGGHSKGGNLAVFAAAVCGLRLQNRIQRVYSFDGPGFPGDFCRTQGYRRIAGKICKIVPAYSMIGMVLQNQISAYPVESMGRGIFQHDMFHWIIKDGDFCYRKGIYLRAVRRMRAVNAWISSLSVGERQDFVNIVYDILSSADAKTIYELSKKPLRRLRSIAKAVRGLDRTAKNFMKSVWKRFFRAYFQVRTRTRK